MPKAIISDTSCFIILTNIGELELLHKVYGQILTTPEIAAEFGEPLPAWVEIVEAKDKYRQTILELQIDKGESSAIALALETPDSTVILDVLQSPKNRGTARHNSDRNNRRNHQSKNEGNDSIRQTASGKDKTNRLSHVC
jgi:predicted nucleic acid-binding protein